jgi:hypothetical protein
MVSAVIAIVSSEPGHWEKLGGIISSCGVRPIRCKTLAAVGEVTAQQHLELVICDDKTPGWQISVN